MLCAGCFNNVCENTSTGCYALDCHKRFCYSCTGFYGHINGWICFDCRASEYNGEDSAPRTTDNGINPNAVQNLLNEISFLTQEISRCHERIGNMEVYISTNESRIYPMESQEVERQNVEIEFMKCAIGDMQAEMNIQMINHLKYEIELCGIPEFTNENLTNLLFLLMNKLGVELSDLDIDWATRVGPHTLNPEYSGNTRPRYRPIVLRLVRRSKRTEIMRASKTRRNITSTDLNILGPAQKVFINERLTHGGRLFFRQCRIQSKRKGYKFCWCNNGIIFVREREGKSALILRSYDDLENLADKKRTPNTHTTMQ